MDHAMYKQPLITWFEQSRCAVVIIRRIVVVWQSRL